MSDASSFPPSALPNVSNENHPDAGIGILGLGYQNENCCTKQATLAALIPLLGLG